jgi:tetratricopeptide (TPR) repeat protein
LSPNLAIALFGKGRVRNAQKKDLEAIPYYDKAIEIVSTNKSISDIDSLHTWKGVSLAMLKRYEEALSSFERALEINPNHSDASTRKQNIMDFLKSTGGRHYDSNV